MGDDDVREDVTFTEAFAVMKKYMQEDGPCEPGSLAHGWHCNIAMMCYDAMGDAGYIDHDNRHRVGNDAASRFMKLAFDVETKA